MAWPSGKAEACKASIPSSNLGATFFIPFKPMLYLISTPIGNLKDISFRAIHTLKSCHYILCEDTRHSQKLLHHYEIKQKLISHHQFNEASREDQIIKDLKEGLEIGIISDAGTPGISDPGIRLVKRCKQENIPVVSIPGACAAICAITCSGLDTDKFQYLGFLPKKESELHRTLIGTLQYTGTSICYESPKRLKNVLRKIAELDPNREIVIARELTKKFEEVRLGLAKDLTDIPEPKGEIVLLISPNKEDNPWKALSPEEHVTWLEETYKLSKKDAIKMTAEMRGVPKRDIYNKYI